MGWASAGILFAHVADALIEAGASDDIMDRHLTPVIAQLLDNDWDTADYHLSKYAGHPGIAAAFGNNGLTLDDASAGDDDAAPVH